MKCHVCGANMTLTKSDLPFKVSTKTIVIVRDLPVYECENCFEYSLSDSVMAHVDSILNKVDETAELEIVRFAA